MRSLRFTAAGLFAVALVGALGSGTARGDAYWEITRLTDNTYMDHAPSISGTNVLWRSRKHEPDTISSRHSILLYDGSGVSTLMSAAEGAYFLHPRIDGTKAVWCDLPEVFLYDGSSVTQLTHDRGNYLPGISGSNITWRHNDGNDTEIFFHDGSSAVRLTDNDYDDRSPRISESGIVWEGQVGSTSDIFLYDGSSVKRLTDSGFDDVNPQIDTGKVVWQGFDGNDYEIFLYDGSAVTQLTDNDCDDVGPRISGLNVAWKRDGAYEDRVMLYDGSSTREISVHPCIPGVEISGSNLVWTDAGGPREGSYRGGDIFFYDGAEVTQLTDEGRVHAWIKEWEESLLPQISGSNIVWTSLDGPTNRLLDETEIYFARYIPEPAVLLVLCCAAPILLKRARRA